MVWNLPQKILGKIINIIFGPFFERKAVEDISVYLKISVSKALRRARIKDLPQEDKLWRSFKRQNKEDYRDYYSKNLHYLERQDWYNRCCSLDFLRFIPKKGHILDYGCGTAYVLAQAKRKRPDINLHLADIPEALTKEFAVWRFNKNGIDFSWYDIGQSENIEFPVKFDFIRCHDVLEHTFHPDKVVEIFFHSLNVGGVLSFDFLKDNEFKKENTHQAQRLRDKTLKYVEVNFDILRRKGSHYLVRKPISPKSQRCNKPHRNRLLLCTSPLQVVNARAAMDYNQREGVVYRDYLAIIHPALTSRSKELIKEFGEKLGFNVIYDFCDSYREIMNIISEKYKFKSVPFMGRTTVKTRDARITSILEEARNILHQHVQGFEEVYIRQHYGSIEQLVLGSILKNKAVYGIEEGIGDYCDYLTKVCKVGKYLWRLGSYEHFMKNLLRALIFKSKTPLWRIHCYNFLSFYIMKNRFTNLKHKNNTVIGEYFKKNLEKLKKNEYVNKNKKVAIIGSVLDVASKYHMTTVQEVEIYNKLIPIIKKRHVVGNGEIFYKPHPRTTYDSWAHKKKHLDCQIYDFHNNNIFEVELVQNDFKAVYSVVSTSLLLAKGLFGVDAYFIDLRKFNIHPSHIDICFDIFTRYGVKVQPVLKEYYA